MKKIYSVLLILFCSVCFAQVPTTGLISHWPFSGNANDIVGGNNGTVFNANLTTDRFGNAGCAYNFNGTNSYIKALNAGPTGTLSRSFSLWARTNNTVVPSSTNYVPALFAYGAAPGALALQLNYGCAGIGPDCGSVQFTKSNSNVADGNWHHYVLIFDNTTGTNIGNMQIYMDGSLLTASVCNGGTVGVVNTNSTFPLNFGKVADNNIRFFTGDLDDFYLYNRALTSTEVMALYNETQCTATTPAPSPITGSIVVCPGSVVVYSVAPVPGASSYSWNLPGGWTGGSTSNTISVTAGSSSGNITVSAKNCCGYSQPTSLSVSAGCTGIHENEKNLIKDFIFPNPNNGSFTIKIPFHEENMSVEVLNSLGQLIYESAIDTNDSRLKLKLTEGIYFIRIAANSKIIGLQKFAVTVNQ